MQKLPIEIEEGAIFIADAHYPDYGDSFIAILKEIDRDRLELTQLFLMGDIFNLLFGYSQYIKSFVQDAIDLLQKLSKKIDIYYLEGNHDFCLREIFPNIKIYTIEEQPVKFRLNGQDVYISHGDIYNKSLLYKIYTKLIRNRTTIKLLLPFEKYIIEHRIKKLREKNICTKIKNFEKIIESIIEKYPSNALIVEGHFHQNRVYKNYISLPALACQKRVGIVKNGKIFISPTFN